MRDGNKARESTHEAEEKCWKFIEAAEHAADNPITTWATSLGPWNQVVETARELWGERWILCRLANLAAGIRSKSETGGGCANVFDYSAPLCLRTRFARLRSSSARWWKEQLQGAKSEEDVKFVMLVLLSWATTRTVINLLDNMQDALDSLHQESWRQVARGVEEAVIRLREPYEEAGFSVEAKALPSKLSQRMATALAVRANLSSGGEIFGRYLADYEGTDRTTLGVCQELAVSVALQAEERWPLSLECIKRSYAHGVVKEPRWRLARPLYHGSGQVSVQGAREICGRPENYPLYVLRFAEERYRDVVASTIVPVGTVARTNKWFE